MWSTLYPWISLLEIERDIMPILEGCEKNYAYFIDVRTHPLLSSKRKNPFIHMPHDL
jgi:hypothetical protein